MYFSLYTFCCTIYQIHHIKFHHLLNHWLFHKILNVRMSIVFLFRSRSYFYYINHAKNNVKIKIFEITRKNRFLCTKTKFITKNVEKNMNMNKKESFMTKISKNFCKIRRKLFRFNIHYSTNSRHEANDEKNYVAYRNYLKI